MNTDSYFWIGSSHKICQDYALHNDNCVIVCDGCSSSPNTDFGSRILAKVAESYLPILSADKTEYFAESVARRSQYLINDISLPNESLDSTLLIADHKNIYCFGDGVVCFKSDRLLWFLDIEYPSGAPFYLSYFSDPKRYEKYKETFGLERIVKSYIYDIKTGKFEKDDVEIIQDDSIGYIYHYGNITDPLIKPNIVAIMSDGVKSFFKTEFTETTKTQVPIPLKDVLYDIVNYKTYTGQFVERRCNRFIKDCVKNNMQNFDDVSIGVIKL